MKDLDTLAKGYLTIREPRMKTVLRLQASIGTAIREYLDGRGFLELLAPIIGPATDPGIRGAEQAAIDFYGRRYKLMSSAILYKQMAMASLGKIYFFSPNIRLEPLESAKTRRHLCEFFQVDIEQAYSSYMEAMGLAEGLLQYVVKTIKERHGDLLVELGRRLRIPKLPFRKITHREAVEMLRSEGYNISYQKELPWNEEKVLSSMFEEPFFVYDYPAGSRGFYDRDDPERPGILRDFDMLYPEGYGEAVSGAEREYHHEEVVEKMRSNNENPDDFSWYIEMLKEGIPPSAGFGIGVERLTRYVCGLEEIWEARPYPKVAGVFSP
jgi:asparaginyl-tRNA synthetase